MWYFSLSLKLHLAQANTQNRQAKFSSSTSHPFPWDTGLASLYSAYASVEGKNNQSSSLTLLIYYDSTSQAVIGNTYSLRKHSEKRLWKGEGKRI